MRYTLTVAALLAMVGATLSACGGGGGGRGTSSETVAPPAQLPAVDVSRIAANDPGSTLPEHWEAGAVMQIYVRGYQDSDGDGIGDLRGLIQRLDYLQALGVRGIWLMPVTRSSDRDHGYAVADYRDIESDYGSLADFDALLAQAHARGIAVIVDYVMNHSADTHPLFVNAKAGPANAYRSWYVWQDPAPANWRIYGIDPWHATRTGAYYGAFSTQMPDFNLRNPDVVAWHKDNLRFWLNRGVDGIRFDAVGNLFENGPANLVDQPENYALMGDMRTLVTSYQRRFMVSEAPVDPIGFGSLGPGSSAFAFQHQTDILAAARGDQSAAARVAGYFPAAPLTMSTMLANHDSFAGTRVWNQLDGNDAQYRLAAATYLLQPGTPFIYYGEEIGMSTAPLPGDPGLRAPMSWSADGKTAGFTTGTPFRALASNAAVRNVAAQSADPGSLLSFYKAMLALRNTRPSIARGNYVQPKAEGAVVSFRRELDGEATLVVINYGSASAQANVEGLPPGAVLQRLYPSAGAADMAADAAGHAGVVAPGQSVQVYRLR